MSSRPAPQVPYTALVGSIIRSHRERAGLQQIDIASALGIMQPAYSRIEQGGTSITVAQLRVIARKLEIAPSQLLDEADSWTEHLRRQGVAVTDAKEVPKAALALGLGMLAALLIAAASGS